MNQINYDNLTPYDPPYMDEEYDAERMVDIAEGLGYFDEE